MAKKKRRRKKKNSHAGLLLASALIILIMLCIVVALLFLRHTVPSRSEPSVTEPINIATLPFSELQIDAFTLNESGWKAYEDESYTSAVGIDVSSHQGGIDWPAVKAAGIDYAILRVGYRGYGQGDLKQDDLFYHNLEQARQAGLDIGVYFFSQAVNKQEAQEEAQFVLTLLNGAPLDYPVYYDWETVSSTNARTATVSGTELTECAQTFCNVIESAGYRAGVYFNLSMAYSFYNMLQLENYDFWLAEYNSTISYPFAVSMWQYAPDGRCPGVETNVDLNIRFIRKEG